MATFRIGELLKQRGMLNDAQISEILERQKVSGSPFGAVAAELFGVQEAELWRAWAQQMIDCCPKLSPSELVSNPKSLAFVTPREAWAYRLLPLDWNENEILLVTTAERLPNAMAYAQIKAPVPAVFAVADRLDLEAAIRRNYGLSSLPMVA